MDRLTKQRLREIEERVNNATPGPWYVNNPDDADCANVLAVTTCQDEIDDLDTSSFRDAGKVVAITLLQNPSFANVHDDRWDENTEFIAHSRTDIPVLLSEARQLRFENEWLLQACKAALKELIRMYVDEDERIYLAAAKRYLRRAIKVAEGNE